MNLNEIKEIIAKDQGKFIIVEDGEPTMVILSFQDYKKMISLKGEEQIPFEEPKEFSFGHDEETEETEDENGDKDKDEDEDEDQETKENFVSAPLHGEGFSAETTEESEKVPEELEDEPLKIEDLPF